MAALVAWVWLLGAAGAQVPERPAIERLFAPGEQSQRVFESAGKRTGEHTSRFVGPETLDGRRAEHFHGSLRLEMPGAIEEADYYEWGGQDPRGAAGFSDRRPGWDLPIHQLMATAGVTIFFQGHDHLSRIRKKTASSVRKRPTRPTRPARRSTTMPTGRETCCRMRATCA
jgi:hypothetical protein